MSDDCKLVVVAPETVMDAVLIDSNVAESLYPVWAAGTSYTVGDRVHVVATHRDYQAVTAGAGKPPATSPNDWVDAGPSNRWAPFDKSVGSQAAHSGTITYRLRFGRYISHITALNLAGAQSIRVYSVDPTAGKTYDRTIDVRRLPVTSSSWQWFFGKKSQPTQAIFDDVLSYPTADIYVEITGDALLAVGSLIFGVPQEFTLGVQYGAQVGIQDYSRKERTQFGDSLFVQRAYARRASFTMVARAGEVDALMNFMASVRTTPCLWIGSEKYEAATIYGIYKNFDITIAYPEYSIFTLDLEGLT